MSDKKYIEGIKSTGFGLEFTISKSLTTDNWTVINNKYYIDDVQGSAREIDILAYKVTVKDGIQIYTVLIISCKKSSENAWALLAKDKNNKDPNIDWNPVTLWSNQKILKFIIENYDWKTPYVNSSQDLNDQLFSPQKHIFAFQELNKNKGTPQNDKAIFNSIVSSMKSQDYEIASLDKRKKQEAIYNFNLISVVQAPLLRINYGDDEPSVDNISSDIYVGSYIINKRETISRVHFIMSEEFDSFLGTYNRLHSHNVQQTSVIFESYFADCLKDNKKVDLFLNEFSQSIRFNIYRVIRGLRSDDNINNVIGISWKEAKKSVAITVDDVWREEEVEALNSNSELKVKVAAALKKIYRYEGEFYFDDSVPF